MNPDSILAIFSKFSQLNTVISESLSLLADSANEETPNDSWKELADWDIENYLPQFEEWLKNTLLTVDNTPECTAVYFLLFDTLLNENTWGQDVYVHPSENFHTEDTFEEWNRDKSNQRSNNPIYLDIVHKVKFFEHINGYSDYAIPLLLTGALIYGTTKKLCQEEKLKFSKDIGFGIGYRYGDSFNLAIIQNNKLVPKIERLI